MAEWPTGFPQGLEPAMKSSQELVPQASLIGAVKSTLLVSFFQLGFSPQILLILSLCK